MENKPVPQNAVMPDENTSLINDALWFKQQEIILQRQESEKEIESNRRVIDEHFNIKWSASLK